MLPAPVRSRAILMTDISEILKDRNLLARIRLLNNVSPESVENYLERCGTRSLNAGDVLIEPRTRNDHVYVILSGRLRVHLELPDSPPLTVLDVGDCAGEMSIVEEREPSAFVVADSDAEVLLIDQETIWDMVNASHGFARNLLVILSERVRSDNEVIADSVVVMRQYEHSAMTDALTDLHNRHWLQDMFRRNMERCRVSGEPVCIFMLDVDGFKAFNDRHGHLKGDEILCEVADVLRSELRPTDMLARFGGDEFAVLLPGANLDDAMTTAERIRYVMANHVYEAGVTLSLGVAEMGEEDTLSDLIAKADEAMYRATASGRNRVSK